MVAVKSVEQKQGGNSCESAKHAEQQDQGRCVDEQWAVSTFENQIFWGESFAFVPVMLFLVVTKSLTHIHWGNFEDQEKCFT